MPDFDHSHDESRVVDLIDDTVVPNPNAPGVAAGEFDTRLRSSILLQVIDRDVDTPGVGRWKLVNVALDTPRHKDRIGHG
jgi:hypothetical protein